MLSIFLTVNLRVIVAAGKVFLKLSFVSHEFDPTDVPVPKVIVSESPLTAYFPRALLDSLVRH
jgi:hypothetical protein